jgi:hypothetical protein
VPSRPLPGMIEGMRIRLPSWSATSPAGRLLLAVAAALALLGTGAVSVALRTPPTRITHTIAAIAPPAAALDAAGCPPAAHCLVRSGLPDHILLAIRHAFPAGRLLWQSSTVDAGSAQVYQAQAAATLGPGASLVLTAQCLPGSATRDPDVEDTSAGQRSDLAGNHIALVTLRHRRVGGAPGCQLEMVLAAPEQGSEYLAGFGTLGRDPAAQVHQ